MDYTFLERLKIKVIAGAQSSAARIEDAARTGKIHLDLMAARRKLERTYTALGKETHHALSEDSFDGVLALRPGISELRAEISAHMREISALEIRLAEAREAKSREASAPDEPQDTARDGDGQASASAGSTGSGL